MCSSDLKLATKLYITEVQTEVAGDAFFETVDLAIWQLADKQDHTSANGLAYSDLIYLRK